MLNRIAGAVSLIVLGLAGYAGYQLTEANLRAEIYRDRLAELAGDYDRLLETYNQAVRRTAVTELVVEDGGLSVSIRNAEGEIRSIPTPFDPSGEIYVDYVVMDGRLWIRRVFDAHTPPSEGVVIDPELGEVNWQDQRAAHGKAVYRQLDEGRWVVSVTGDGSLGLTRTPLGEPPQLADRPQIKDYEPILEQARAEADHIGPSDILRRLLGGRSEESGNR
ncbi:MAG: hypothetical protein Kow00105_07660 [Phycisphaeraceae bacterium]